jgi:metal-responsive CopG/Arc/MetJ family transcriptional regulator
MPKTRYAKISISLPEQLLADLEQQSASRGESRSEVIAEAVERFLREERRRLDDAAYARAYREQPESPEEIAEQVALLQATAPFIAREYPWDED